MKLSLQTRIIGCKCEYESRNPEARGDGVDSPGKETGREQRINLHRLLGELGEDERTELTTGL